MSERKRKRKQRFKAEYEAWGDEFYMYLIRYGLWIQVLTKPLSDEAIQGIALVLARSGFDPNDNGTPRGSIPREPQLDPIVYLDALEWHTDAWCADLLEAATRAWCGLEASEDDLGQVPPIHVAMMLETCDMARFWRRPGVGMTRDEVRAALESGSLVIDGGYIRDSRRSRKPKQTG